MAPDPRNGARKISLEDEELDNLSIATDELNSPAGQNNTSNIRHYVNNFFSFPKGRESTQAYRPISTDDLDQDASRHSRTPSLTYIESLEDSYDEEEDKKKQSKVKNAGTTQHSTMQYIFGWLSMILAIIAGASIGPVFRYMMTFGITPLLAASWRCQAMVLCLIPTAVWEVYSKNSKPINWFGKQPDLPFPVVVHLLVASLGWAFSLLFWIVGLRYISTFKASILATCHPILLVFWMRCNGKVVSYAEWIGVFTAFLGVFVSNLSQLLKELHGSSPSPSSGESATAVAEGGNATEALEAMPWHYQLLGIFFCLLAAFGETIVIVNRMKTRKYVPLFQYTIYTTIVVAITASVTSLLIEDARIWCEDTDCIFGWLSTEWRWKILVFGLWVGAVCITGFNYAMSYIPPLIFSSLSLLDPAITAILSWFIGVEDLPTIFSWLGGAIVICGVGIISLGEKHPTGDDDEEDEEEEDNGDDDQVINFKAQHEDDRTMTTRSTLSPFSSTASLTKRQDGYGQLSSQEDEPEDDYGDIELMVMQNNHDDHHSARKEEFAKQFTIE